MLLLDDRSLAGETARLERAPRAGAHRHERERVCGLEPHCARRQGRYASAGMDPGASSAGRPRPPGVGERSRCGGERSEVAQGRSVWGCCARDAAPKGGDHGAGAEGAPRAWRVFEPSAAQPGPKGAPKVSSNARCVELPGATCGAIVPWSLVQPRNSPHSSLSLDGICLSRQVVRVPAVARVQHDEAFADHQ